LKKKEERAKVDVDKLIDDLDSLERANMKPVNQINQAVREVVISSPVEGSHDDILGTNTLAPLQTQRDIAETE